MDIPRRIASRTHIETPSYDFFFSQIDYCLNKGRGFSVFNADESSIAGFSEQCGAKGLRPLTLGLSSLESSSLQVPDSVRFVILIQDLSYDEFFEQAPEIADKVVFPLWFRRIPICWFSYLPRESYENHPIRGENLHKDSSLVIRALLAEQVLSLLERSNYEFTSPELLDVSAPDTVFTPVEERLLQAMETHKLSYQPRVRLGRQVVDFLVDVQNSKVIVECDGETGRPASATTPDEIISLHGYPVCRLSGSEIYADVDKCIRTIQETINYKARPSYSLEGDLDASQREAVQFGNGPIRVLAPAGSGKTKTLVNRILYLLNQGISPDKILALAFNKKARDEMQDRLDRRGVAGVEIRTFHSFGYEIVHEGLGWTFSGAAYKRTSKELMRSAILEHTELPALRNQDPLDAFLDGLRRAKMELSPLSTLTVEYADQIYPLEPIFYSYMKKQLEKSFLDFDDMIYLAVRLLLENRSLRQLYQSRFEFVLVDEFQDLNEAQLLLLQIIGLPENNIFAVGDDDQMIYGFRGADVKHIVEFDKRFPIASSHVLDTNYRSSQMIVRHSGWLIDHNVDRVGKNIRPRKGAQPGKFEVSGHSSLIEQAAFAAKWLVEHKKEHNLNWKDYAVLYRYNAYQSPVALLLDAMAVPHTPVPGQHLFQTMAGADILSYLQVILFPDEARASDFDRILKRPNKYLTNQLIARARDWDTFRALPETPNLRSWERERLNDFITRLDLLAGQARQQEVSTAGFMQKLKKEFDLVEFYRDQSRRSADLDQAGDEVILDVITALAENFKTPAAFYQFIGKSMDDAESRKDSKNGNAENENSSANEVYLGTIHRAKGKEFQDVVYFNLSKTDMNSTQPQFIEEERRVAYVGVTRPKDDLLITFSSANPSDFLLEIALNPKFKSLDDADLQRHSTSTRLEFERQKVISKQLKVRKMNALARFNELTKAQADEWPVWLQGLVWRIQNWRIDKMKTKIQDIDSQIQNHRETRIIPLSVEIREIEEESTMRVALNSSRIDRSTANDKKEAETSVLVTMRVKVHDFEGTKQAVARYGDALMKAGCHWYKVYQRDGDEKEILWLMEFDSHEAFEKSGAEFEEDFVTLIDPASDWDDSVWNIFLQSEQDDRSDKI